MKIEKSLLSGSTPMLVLSLLKDGDKYGYEMVETLARRSDDTFQLKEGTLYPLLHALEKERLTAETPPPLVPITKDLQNKSLKDITPADTTDYRIAGTLVTHELRNGETIIYLTKKYYGDKRLWPYIVKHNQMNDFNNVAIGQMINIPILEKKP